VRGDLSPQLGTPIKMKSHVRAFLEWAAKRHQTTIAHVLLQQVDYDEAEEVLGSTLAFIRDPLTREILRQWQHSHPFAPSYLELSEALSTSPNVVKPLTSGYSVSRQFRSILTTHYFAAQFCSELRCNLSLERRLNIHTLRVWLFLFAATALDKGFNKEKNLRAVCMQLRMALDSTDSEEDVLNSPSGKEAKKLAWFLTIATHRDDFSMFTIALESNLQANEPTDDGPLQEVSKSFKRLIAGAFIPDEEQLDVGVLAHTLPRPWLQTVAKSPDLVQPSLFSEGTSTRILAPNQTSPGDEQVAILEAKFEDSLSPPEASHLTRRIALQTQEDRQYLGISWTRLAPWEWELFWPAVEEAFRSGNEHIELLAAITVVTLITQSTMVTVRYVLLSDAATIAGDQKVVWTFDPNTGHLKRLASRQQKALKIDPDSPLGSWSQPTAEEWVCQLAAPFVQALQLAKRKHPAARSVADLWPEGLEQAFNRWIHDANPSLWRLSSGFLSVIGEQRAFEHSADATFSRLLLAWPQAATTGAMSYPGWSRAEVAGAFQAIAPDALTALPDVKDHVNAMGSRLDPIDDLVAREFRTAKSHLEILWTRNVHWTQFHNALTTYGMQLLLAVTAARPTRSVFESLRHFDLRNQRLFIDDKASLQTSGGRTGRIVPLHTLAKQFVEEIYLPYLQYLRALVKDSNPELAAALNEVLDGSLNAGLPLFFKVSRQSPFDWLEITPSTLIEDDLFAWPLPANAFRHRMATHLRRCRLDTELIDAQLGHAEAGSETFGDNSTRCWAQEEAGWKKALHDATRPLALELPNLRFTAPAAPLHPGSGSARLRIRPYGIKARQIERSRVAESARLAARREIANFVGSTPPESMDFTKWDELRQRMVFDKDGRTLPGVQYRYEEFQEYLRNLCVDQGLKISVKSWSSPLDPGKAAFDPKALQAEAQLQRVRSAIDLVHESFRRSSPSRLACAWVCVFELAANSLVCDHAALGVILDPKAGQLGAAVIDDMSYLEICPADRTLDQGPVKRFVFPPRSLHLLSNLLQGTTDKLYKRPETPPSVRPLLESLDLDPARTTLEVALRTLAQWVDLSNSLNLSGIQAAALSGRISTHSLSHEDHLRAVRGSRFQFDVPPAGTDEDAASTKHARATPIPGSVLSAGTSMPLSSPPPEADTKPEKTAGKRGTNANAVLLSTLRKIALAFQDGRKRAKANTQPSPNPTQLTGIVSPAGAVSPLNRESAIARMKSEITQAQGNVNKNVWLLAQWTLHLLQHGATKELEGSTVARYLGALSAGFVAYSDDIDLLEADPEEVTEFYTRVIDPALVQKTKDSGQSGSPTAVEPKKNQQFVLDRLIEFHRFSERYGATTPHWDELSEGLTNSAVSPGFITPAEYIYALKRLCPDPRAATGEQLLHALFLMLVYRFGLRGMEAIHVAKRNWVEVKGAIVLIVDHFHKRLKTPKSRRKVPLIGRLSKFEREVVDCWMAFRAGSIKFRSDKDRLLVDPRGVARLADLPRIRHRVTEALRHATLNPATKLHHTRHSMANLVGVELLPDPSMEPQLWAAGRSFISAGERGSRSLLLGSTSNTRRALWAVARCLGHSRGETTCSSYLHFLLDWCAISARSGASKKAFDGTCKVGLVGVTYLDGLTRDASYLSHDRPLRPMDFATVTPPVVVEYLRSRGRGLNASSAATGTFGRLQSDDAHELEEVLGTVCARFTRGSVKSDLTDHVFSFASRVPESRWETLLGLASQGHASGVTLGRQALEQPSSRFQILLAKQHHFSSLQSLMRGLGLKPAELELLHPATIHPQAKTYLNDHELSNLPTPQATAANRLQVDSYVGYKEVDPLATYAHRLAARVAPTSTTFIDGIDLMVVWLALSIPG